MVDASDRETIYTVASLNRQVKTALERTWGNICLEAEVSAVTFARSGHVYFKLVDPDGKATVDAVMWRGMAARYGKHIQEGALLRCFGRVTLYELGGRYQFVAERIEDSGEGAKARALAELKERLQKEGLFALERKRPLPPSPACVGVVTSRTGAALQDIIAVSSRRFPTRLLLAHASVQGELAVAEIVSAIALLNTHPDVEVLIVGRGGGASEDLDAFNDERVVRAVAESRVPVVCAVGHEVDITLAELASDRRAATPSEAAELVAPDAAVYLERFTELKQRLWLSMKARMGSSRERQSDVMHRLSLRDPRVRLRMQAEKLSRYQTFFAGWKARRITPVQKRMDELRHRLDRFAATAVQSRKGDLMAASAGLYNWPAPAMAKAKGDLGRLAASLNALSPLASLGRGYSIARDDDGRIVKSVEQVTKGQHIEVIVADGMVDAHVDGTTKKTSSS
ncbi:MAG: exodeoxyribonuclease VII large subunit [Deltaproteobacteria bacterium]|nr:exodeoxyribonuclease VII large subunit [Deltaproteobacteria bacterium]